MKPPIGFLTSALPATLLLSIIVSIVHYLELNLQGGYISSSTGCPICPWFQPIFDLDWTTSQSWFSNGLCDEGGWSTKGASYLLENPRYTHLASFVCHLMGEWLFLADLLVSSLWHGRFACLSKTGITQLSKASYTPQFFYSGHKFCEHCQYDKCAALPHTINTPRESEPVNLVHSNVCGPMLHPSLSGALYFIHVHQQFYQKSVGIFNEDQRKSFCCLLRLACDGWKSNRSKAEMHAIRW